MPQKNGSQYLNQWIDEGKLACTEEVGDACRQFDPELSHKIYSRAGAGSKCVEMLAQSGNWGKLRELAKQGAADIDWKDILKFALNSSPEDAMYIARALTGKENEPQTACLINVTEIGELFLQNNAIPQFTGFMLTALKDNLPQEAQLQTKVLEINLATNPQTAECIFQANILTQ